MSARLPCALAALLLVGCGQRDLAPIRLESFTTLGATDGPGAMATWPRISARHPLGYRIAVPQPGGVPALPVVFDDDGNFMATLGGGAADSGGFVEPLFARIGPGDSVWLFDGARRVVVFSPERRLVRTVALPVAPWDAVVLSGNRMAVTPASFGAPLPWLLLDGDGATIRAIGTPDSTIPTPRRIVPGLDNTVWTIAMTHQWRLEHWDLDGNLLGRLTTPPAWFTPHQEPDAASSQHAPQPAVEDGWVDAAGRLWIVGKVADANWREGVGAPTGGSSPISDPDRAYDTMVDVINPSTGAVIAEARFDPAYPFMAEPGVLMRVLTTDDGWHRAELARVMVDTSRIGGDR